MTKAEEIERLVQTIDEARMRAERLGLIFAVYLLGMARLAIDQSE
ncbi:MAG: hypothetical protein WDN50_08150 [Bradyrhizobium sp.]